jgi:hypothetical protein
LTTTPPRQEKRSTSSILHVEEMETGAHQGVIVIEAERSPTGFLRRGAIAVHVLAVADGLLWYRFSVEIR